MSNQFLIDQIISALPYVEDAATFDDYSESGKREIRKLARQMRMSIENQDAEETYKLRKSLDSARSIARDLYLALDALNTGKPTDEDQADLALSRYAWSEFSTDFLEKI